MLRHKLEGGVHALLTVGWIFCLASDCSAVTESQDAASVQAAGQDFTCDGCVAIGSNFMCAVNTSHVAGCWYYSEQDGSAQAVHLTGNDIRSLAATNGWPDAMCAVTMQQQLNCWDAAGTAIAVPENLSRNIATAYVSFSQDYGGFFCAVTLTSELGCWSPKWSVPEVPKEFLQDVKSIGVTYNAVCVLKNGGQLGCWGPGGFGDDVTNNIPQGWESNVVAIDGGGYHVCARNADKGVACWGRNIEGQCRVPTDRGSKFVEISAGGYHTCGLFEEGGVECWGGGNGGNWLRPEVFFSRNGKMAYGVVAVEAGGFTSSCVVKSSGELRCITPEAVPDAYRNLNGAGSVVAPPYVPAIEDGFHCDACIGAGDSFACGLKAGGLVWCWGPRMPELSIPAFATTHMAKIRAGSTWLPVACGITTHNKLVCWGVNHYGQQDLPATVRDSTSILDVAVGWGHVCALFQDGSVDCWGLNDHNQTDVPAEFATGIVAIAAGCTHTCAVNKSGALGCWGLAAAWQPADGTLNDPLTLKGPLVNVTTGCGHTCVLDDTQQLYCFGGNNVTSIPPGFDTGIVSVAAGNGHACAVRADGAVRCWGGDNNIIQCEDCSDNNAAVVTAGNGLSCVVKRNGNAVCWGTDKPDDAFNVPDDFKHLGQASMYGDCPYFCDLVSCGGTGRCVINGVDYCTDGYVAKEDGTCEVCGLKVEGCRNCVRGSEGGEVQCATCLHGRYLNDEGQCESCGIDACQRCSKDVNDGTMSCLHCLPGYHTTKDGNCEKEESLCEEDEFPFSCNGPLCSAANSLTAGRHKGCISKYNCELLYQLCLDQVGDKCLDCCTRVVSVDGKLWFLMRYPDSSLVQCDPPPINTRKDSEIPNSPSPGANQTDLAPDCNCETDCPAS